MSMQPQEPNREDVAYKAALHRAETLRAYYSHVLVFVVVNAGLFFINLLTRGDDGTLVVLLAARRLGDRHRDPHAGGVRRRLLAGLEAAQGGRDLPSRSRLFVSDLNEQRLGRRMSRQRDHDVRPVRGIGEDGISRRSPVRLRAAEHRERRRTHPAWVETLEDDGAIGEPEVVAAAPQALLETDPPHHGALEVHRPRRLAALRVDERASRRDAVADTEPRTTNDIDGRSTAFSRRHQDVDVTLSARSVRTQSQRGDPEDEGQPHRGALPLPHRLPLPHESIERVDVRSSAFLGHHSDGEQEGDRRLGIAPRAGPTDVHEIDAGFAGHRRSVGQVEFVQVARERRRLAASGRSIRGPRRRSRRGHRRHRH